MGKRGRPPGSVSSAVVKLSFKTQKQLEYLQLALGEPRLDIVEKLIDAKFHAEDVKRGNKLSGALNAELDARRKADELKAALMPEPKATS